jgi:hypothetical protein
VIHPPQLAAKALKRNPFAAFAAVGRLFLAESILSEFNAKAQRGKDAKQIEPNSRERSAFAEFIERGLPTKVRAKTAKFSASSPFCVFSLNVSCTVIA